MKMALNWKCLFCNQNATITIILSAIATIVLAGCNYSYETTKQESWHEDHLRASVVELKFREYGAPLLVTEQLITLIRKPDYKMTPTEFEARIPEYKPFREGLSYREWHIEELWDFYRRYKKQRRGSSKVITANTWRESSEFNECLLWIYDESLHFSKPLHSGDFFYRLFCCEPMFYVYIFFVEDLHVVGQHFFITSKPLFIKGK